MNPLHDTIVSLSTALAIQAVSIIRLSGDRALEITEQLLKKPLSNQDHRLTYGFVHEPITNNVVDEVIILVMKGPRSYTREDIVETLWLRFNLFSSNANRSAIVQCRELPGFICRFF